MASPQLEDGYTRIAHEILEHLCKMNLSAYESRVLFFIFRNTYGRQCATDRIALSQISAATELDKGNVSRAVRSLKKRKFLVVESDRIGFQKDHEKWSRVFRRTPGGVSGDTVSPKTTKGCLPRQQTGVSGDTTIDRREIIDIRAESDKPIPGLLFSADKSDKKPKRNRSAPTIPPELQPIVSRVVARINEIAGTGYKPDSKIVVNGLVPRLKAGASESDCITVVEDRWRDWRDKAEMRQYFNPETLFRESNFEKYLNAARMSHRNGNARPRGLQEIPAP